MSLYIRIQDISDHKSFHHSGEVPLANMEDLVTLAGKQTGCADFDLQLSRSEEIIFLKGAIEGKINLDCDRCLERFEHCFEESFSLTLSPVVPQQSLAKDQVLSSEDLEVGFYQGESIGLLQILEEQVVLGIPMKRICSETCKGFCSQCGINLNLKACICLPPDQLDHPFSDLRR
ncbi:MAG: DUF177 domain-containing protein [SAR324 cluster bacterium]|nr:DUF177 domain-containing protein [SAR324 cluster bacterium]